MHRLRLRALAQIPRLFPALVPAFGLAASPVGAATALGPPSVSAALRRLEGGVVAGLVVVSEGDNGAGEVLLTVPLCSA